MYFSVCLFVLISRNYVTSFGDMAALQLGKIFHKLHMLDSQCNQTMSVRPLLVLAGHQGRWLRFGWNALASYLIVVF